MEADEPFDEQFAPTVKREKMSEEPTPLLDKKRSPRGSPVMDNTSGSSKGDHKVGEGPPAGAFSHVASERRKQSPEKDSDTLIRESALASARAVASATEKAYQDAVMRSSQANKEQERGSKSPSESDDGIREEAVKVLHMADAHLSSPYAVRRSVSGGVASGSVNDFLAAPYSVRRTASGGFSGTHTGLAETEKEGLLGKDEEPYSARRSKSASFTSGPYGFDGKRRVPAALSGIDFTATGRRTKVSDEAKAEAARRFGIDDKHADVARHQSEDETSSEEDKIVDDEMESESDDDMDALQKSNRVVTPEELGAKKDEKSGRTWSSRYSVEHTLLALSGGTMSTRDVLDDMDKEQQRLVKSARNMYATSPHETKTRNPVARMFVGASVNFPRPKTFFGNRRVVVPDEEPDIAKVYETRNPVARMFRGASVNFPSPRSIFGHRRVVVPGDEPNLRTAWVDNDNDHDDEGQSAPLTERSGRPSRQDTWRQRMQSRNLLYLFIICLFLLVIIMSATFGTRDRRNGSSGASSAAGNRGIPIIPGDGTDAGVTFYVTSGVPLNADDEDKFLDDLDALPDDADFLVHLGNLQDASVTFCPASKYSDARMLLSNSPLPVVLVPGSEDWTNCPNPAASLNHWLDNFVGLESIFQFGAHRQSGREENIMFQRDGILFFGVHLVEGPVDDADEWNRRYQDNVDWVINSLTEISRDVRAVVLFGNARPSVQQASFFDGVVDTLEALNKPVAYIHANPGVGGIKMYQPFEGKSNIYVVQIEKGGVNPPLRLRVGSGENAFVVG